MKICSKCKIEKELIEFCKNRTRPDGLRNQCKSCDKQYNIKNADKKRQYSKQYRIDNVDKERKRHKTYRTENGEKIHEYNKQYSIDNADKINQCGKKHRIDNPEYYREYHREYRQTPHGKLLCKQSIHKRRALINDNTPVGKHWTADDIILKLKLQHGKCVYCQVNIKEYFEIDHFIPVSKGGTNEPSNIQLLWKQCNSSGGKGAKLPHEFAQKHGKLV